MTCVDAELSNVAAVDEVTPSVPVENAGYAL